MKLITQLLHPYQETLGADYEAYHHHAQRVYGYAITFLLMRENRKLAIAAAFHDLDIWVSGSMDYLEGSAQLAEKYLAQSDFTYLPDEVRFIIQQHHQLSPIRGNIEAEAFRKADLVDLTSGWVRYNLPQSIVADTERRFPRHRFTRKMGAKIWSYAWRHPLKPFPMIRR